MVKHIHTCLSGLNDPGELTCMVSKINMFFPVIQYEIPAEKLEAYTCVLPVPEDIVEVPTSNLEQYPGMLI